MMGAPWRESSDGLNQGSSLVSTTYRLGFCPPNEDPEGLEKVEVSLMCPYVQEMLGRTWKSMPL